MDKPKQAENASAVNNIESQTKSIGELKLIAEEFEERRDVFSEKTSSYISSLLQRQITQFRTGATTDSQEERYLDLLVFFRIVFRNLWIIILITVIGTAASYFLINSQTRIYEAEASLAITPNFDADAIPRPIQDIDVALGTYVQALRSRNLNASVDTVMLETYDDRLVNRVDTTITPVENSSIIVVSVQSQSPELAQDYANEIVNQITTNNPLPLFEVSYRVIELDDAELPDNPVYPDVRFGIIFGAIGSALFGIMIAFLYDTFFRRKNKTQKA